MAFCNFSKSRTLVFFSFLCCVLGKRGSYDDQPQIYTIDGHLHFQVPKDKSVKFIAQGLTINDMDVLSTLNSGRNATILLSRYQFVLSSLNTHLDSLESRISAFPTNISNGNQSFIPPRLNTRLAKLNRRINNLQKRLTAFLSLLTNDECAKNPCKNGGSCRDIFNGYICQCQTGWEGPTCQNDVNECARFAGTDLGCQNGATCTNKPGTYECLCQNGWLGLHCTRKTADCNTGGTELCGHGTCIPQNTPAGYKCICDQGWTTDGTHLACTVDVDECKQNHPPCSTNPLVSCINVPGSFYCQHCPPGYTGNGYYCADINECELAFNGGCSMNPKVECINTPGSSKCASCPPGYQGDGKICTYQGICNVNNGGCHLLAKCQDNPSIGENFVQCICPPGYVGNGIGINGCTANPSYQASCDPNPCLRGSCVAMKKSFKCVCPAGYYGNRCERQGNPCDSNPCLNGGTCQNLPGGYFKCTCMKGYLPPNCAEEAFACGGTITEPNGTLRYPSGDFFSRRGTSCAWIISTNKDKVLNITFNKFEIGDEQPCNTDFLQIHDGKSTLSHAFGRFCGKKLPLNGTLLTTHPVVYLWYKADNPNSNFEISWTSQNPACGAVGITDKQGVITSPGYPGMYPNNRDCIWSFLVPPGKMTQFHFSFLNIGNNADCTKDWIEFSTLGRKIATICNSTMPSPFYSGSRLSIMHFHTDSANNYPGFQLAYQIVSGTPGCGGVFTARSGVLKAVEITSESPEEIMCEYQITLPSKSRIQLTFLEMNIGKLYPNKPGCEGAFVAIYKGRDTDKLIGKYCGNEIPGSYTVYGQDILVVSVLKKGRTHNWKLKYETICGDVFTAPSGSFESHFGATTCIFQIERPPGNIIILDLTPTRKFIEVRDGDSENSTLIGIYTNLKKTKVESSANYLWVKVEKSAYEIVRANYTSVDLGCGGILKAPIGTIQSPTQPSGEYPANKVCRWVMIAPPGQVIQLNWMTFNLEKSYECAYDNIQIFDNSTNDGTGWAMGKFCGDSKPPILLSSSNIMTIVFVSDNTINGEGFLASYAFIKESRLCGGNYFTTAGQIKSPGYPEEYPTNKECIWVISVPSGMQIELNVTDFNIEDYSNCRYDYLEIRNGGTSASPLIGKFCGSEIPKLIPSHTNKLYLKFVSDTSRVGHGFRIVWSSTSSGCGGILTSPTGTIISPHYPEPYNTNADCLWKISVSAGSQIQVIFADIELEKHNKCGLDYVELFDGSAINSKSLGKFCNSHNIEPVTTSGNHLLVRFRSDVSFQGRGFHLQYSTVCKNTLRGLSGVIESPNFPNGYPQSQDCMWQIIVPNKNKINITFSHFELERSTTGSGNSTCQYDYVELDYLESSNEMGNDQTEAQFTKYNRFCGDQNPGFITIDSNHVRVSFHSDSLLLGAGFRLEWYIFGCGGVLTHPQGEIMSPNYPNQYPALIECIWLIKVPLGKSIEITFAEIDVERDSVNCNYDYVQIFNGEDEGYNLLAKFCHQMKPTTLTTSGNAMFIKFKADWSYQGRGFKANYTTVDTKCGGILSATQGSIFSPNYPNNYNKNDTCEWLIDTDENHVVELTFNDVDLLSPPLATCDTNYVKVFDGPTQAYPRLETVCGAKKPNDTIVSTYNHMFVEFKAANTVTSKGFMADYKKSCGARIKATSRGNIELPKDFDTTEKNCTWIIEAEDPSKHIHLQLTHITTEIHSWCSDGEKYIYIYNGPFADSPLLGSYCNKVPPLLVSDGNSLRIDVTSNMDFFATYSVFEEECGASLTSLDGYIANPGYPNKYPRNVQCEWTITGSPGNTIALNFEKFNIPESDHCNTDYLEIRKYNSSGPLMGVFCGKNLPTNLTHAGGFWIFLKTSDLEPGDVVGDEVKGFYLEFLTSANNKLTGPRGTIANPLYPKGFRELGNDYTWTITVAKRKRVLITFKEFFVGDLPGSYDDCFGTSVKVYDGPSEESPLIRTMCGSEIPKPILSSSNEVFISGDYFTTRLYTIFKFDWEEVALDYQLESDKNASGCSQSIFVNDSYQLKSPGYPHGYAANLNCEWILSTDPIYHLEIKFVTVDLSRLLFTRGCMGDVIEIYKREPESLDWEEVTKVCELPTDKLIVSGTNLMKVVFKTDKYMNKTGFSLSVTKECGANIVDTSGYITYNSSRFGIFNKGTYRCNWTISVRSGKMIEVTFEEFDLGPNVTIGCEHYVMLRNGKFFDSPFLDKGKFCGTTIPVRTPLKTTGNHMRIEYRGMTKITNKGFRLRYKEVGYNCGGEIILDKYQNSTEISSPNFPNIPPPHTECVWRIRAPPGERIRIDFEERFDLTRANFNNECVKEYVEIRDGGTELAPLLSRSCGDQIPSTNLSSDYIMYIKFFTDTNDPRNGFKAKVSIGFCGGTIRGSGEIESPSFVGIEKTLECVWFLKGSTGTTLTVNFTEINMRKSLNCSDDINKIVLTEYDPYFGNATELGVFCGSELPGPLTSLSNIIQVRYKINTAYTQNFKLKFEASTKACTEMLEQESGTIYSPGYPNSQHRDRYCVWQIQVPKGRRITFHIDDFDIDSSVRYSFLAIFNGLKVGSRIAFSNIMHTGDTYESSDNTANVIYWSQYESTKRGIKISFTSNKPTVCRGDFNQTSGVLSQPLNFKNPYWCRYDHYNINKSQTLALTVTMKTNSTNTNNNCRFKGTGIEILALNTKIVKWVCGNLPTPIIVRAPYLVTNLLAQRTILLELNYTVVFNTYNCGGRISGQIGSIASPKYPNKPLANYECAWALKLDEGQNVKINITNFNLGSDCDKHFLAIYNGESTIDPRIRLFCGNNHPNGVLITQTNEVFIEYRHDASETNGNGFNLTYEPVINGCGGIYQDKWRVIQTPNYNKGDYPENAECEWEIISPPGNFIRLEFLGRFNIEQSDNCIKDFVQIWDWKNDNWTSLGRYCGREVPQYIHSTSTQMKILFRSNDKINGGGFKAQWDTHCGGTFEATGTPQYIVSPDFPDTYRGRLHCEYNITSNKNVNLKFLEFDLENGNPTCPYDNVTVHGTVFGKKFKQLGVFCGNSTPPPFRVKKSIRVVFSTDPSQYSNGKGFRMVYQDDSCGGRITSPTDIEIEGFLSNRRFFQPELTCIWNIEASDNRIVVFNIKKLSMTSYTTIPNKCLSQSLQIFDSKEITKNRIMQACTEIVDISVPSTSNKMIVTLRTYPSSFQGLEAEIYFTYGPAQGCGGNINLTESHTINSPNNLKDLDCMWKIIAPTDYQIQINFTSIKIPGHCGYNLTKNFTYVCECAFVEVRDGGGPLSDLLARLCSMDNGLSRSFITMGNTGFIRLFSWGIQNDIFRVTLTPIKSKCGKTYLNVTETHKELTSPNYPNHYPEDLKCVWNLIAPPTSRIFLNFEVFDLDNFAKSQEIVEDCDGQDMLEVIEDPNRHIIIEGLGPNAVHSHKGTSSHQLTHLFRTYNRQEFCGTDDKPFHYYSVGNTLSLEFKTFAPFIPSVSKGKGFKLTYGIAGCDLNLTADNGRVTNFRSKSTQKDCVVTITVPENRTISMYFSQFYSLPMANCNGTGMEVRDFNSTGPILMNACGFKVPNPIFSRSNKVYIHTYQGSTTFPVTFDFLYTSSDKGQGCGGYIYNYRGVITSPLFPNGLLNNSRALECTWNIHVPIGHDVTLTFNEFDIQGSCVTTMVVVTTYKESGETTEHTFCAPNSPAMLRSVRKLTIVYYFSANNPGRGWKATFEGTDKKETAVTDSNPLNTTPRVQ